MKKSKICGSILAVFALVSSAAANADQIGESIVFGAVYTGDVWHNQHGGLRTGTAYLDNLDLTLDVDTDKLFGGQGGHWFAYALYNNGGGFSSTYVGDAQVVSNIETVRALRLYEFWYEQQFGDDGKSLRAGLYDLNSEFYATESSALFINSAHGIGTDFSQTGEAGPSIFSITGLALRWQHNVNADWSYRAAVIDAVPGDPDHPDRTVVELRGDEGALWVGEIEFHPGSYRLGLGSWRYSRQQPRFDDESLGNSRGGYGFAEVALDGASLDKSVVRVFLRGGVASDAVNRFDNFIGGGMVFNGELWGRGDDEAGFALARAHNGHPYRDVLAVDETATTPRELNLELTYRFCFNDRLALQPDIQYIVSPDSNPDLDNALVVGLRAEVTLY